MPCLGAWHGHSRLQVLPAEAAAIYVTPTIVHRVIQVSGEIQPGEDVTFEAVSRGLPATSAVNLNSPGGDVPTAIHVGRLFRQRGFSNSVYTTVIRLSATSITPLNRLGPTITVMFSRRWRLLIREVGVTRLPKS